MIINYLASIDIYLERFDEKAYLNQLKKDLFLNKNEVKKELSSLKKKYVEKLFYYYDFINLRSSYDPFIYAENDSRFSCATNQYFSQGVFHNELIKYADVSSCK